MRTLEEALLWMLEKKATLRFDRSEHFPVVLLSMLVCEETAYVRQAFSLEQLAQFNGLGAGVRADLGHGVGLEARPDDPRGV